MHDQGIGSINKVFHAYSTDFHEGPGPVQTWIVCNNLGPFDVLYVLLQNLLEILQITVGEYGKGDILIIF